MKAGDQVKMESGAVLRKVADAQPMGEYKPTAIDKEKGAADFRITYAGKHWSIVWRDGRAEQVTDAKLAKLQCDHTWAADF